MERRRNSLDGREDVSWKRGDLLPNTDVIIFLLLEYVCKSVKEQETYSEVNFCLNSLNYLIGGRMSPGQGRT